MFSVHCSEFCQQSEAMLARTPSSQSLGTRLRSSTTTTLTDDKVMGFTNFWFQNEHSMGQIQSQSGVEPIKFKKKFRYSWKYIAGLIAQLDGHEFKSHKSLTNF